MEHSQKSLFYIREYLNLYLQINQYLAERLEEVVDLPPYSTCSTLIADAIVTVNARYDLEAYTDFHYKEMPNSELEIFIAPFEAAFNRMRVNENDIDQMELHLLNFCTMVEMNLANIVEQLIFLSNKAKAPKESLIVANYQQIKIMLFIKAKFSHSQ